MPMPLPSPSPSLTITVMLVSISFNETARRNRIELNKIRLTKRLRDAANECAKPTSQFHLLLDLSRDTRLPSCKYNLETRQETSSSSISAKQTFANEGQNNQLR